MASNTMETHTTLVELQKKVEELKAKSGVDLSTDEDLALAVMNLISLEEHFFFTNQKTEKGEYLDLLGSVREIRKDLLAKLLPRHEGETWCAGKHLLATVMRLQEVTTKLHRDGKKEEAVAVGKRAAELMSLFWGLRLNLLSLPELKSLAATEKPWTLTDIMNKLVNCCEE